MDKQKLTNNTCILLHVLNMKVLQYIKDCGLEDEKPIIYNNNLIIGYKGINLDTYFVSLDSTTYGCTKDGYNYIFEDGVYTLIGGGSFEYATTCSTAINDYNETDAGISYSSPLVVPLSVTLLPFYEYHYCNFKCDHNEDNEVEGPIEEDKHYYYSKTKDEHYTSPNQIIYYDDTVRIERMVCGRYTFNTKLMDKCVVVHGVTEEILYYTKADGCLYYLIWDDGYETAKVVEANGCDIFVRGGNAIVINKDEKTLRIYYTHIEIGSHCRTGVEAYVMKDYIYMYMYGSTGCKFIVCTVDGEVVSEISIPGNWSCYIIDGFDYVIASNGTDTIIQEGIKDGIDREHHKCEKEEDHEGDEEKNE